MNRWREDLKGVGALDYFIFKSVPMRDSEWGPVIEISGRLMEQLALKAIVTHRVPIRGLEVKFIRKSLGCTIHSFAEKLRLTHGAIQGWEKKDKARLLPCNEIAVRALLAEELKIEIVGYFSEMIGTDSTPKKIELRAS